MSFFEIRNAHKSFGDVAVVKGVSVSVEEGAFVVMVGPSGCGKSTLLRMIAGLEDITSGEILIGGNVVNEVEPKHRDTAMVFQNYALYPHMTVEKNMGFSLRFTKTPKEEIRSSVIEVAKILDLSDYLDRYPRQLSGGQRQRVAMGRAIVRRPSLYLFDEPLSNLDAKLRVQMRSELKAMHARLKTTTIYVTHDQVEAMTMADLIIVLKDGCIEQIGKPLELYDRPANLFVANFIGSPSMNLLEGTFDKSTAAIKLASGGSLPSAARLSESREVICGFRPENVSICSEKTGLAGTITLIEPTGLDTLVVADLGGQSVSAYSRARLSLSIGDQVHFAVPQSAIHLFDPSTALRLSGI